MQTFNRVLLPLMRPEEKFMDSAALPENLQGKGNDVESQRQKEEEFWAYFGRLVSEWNPCFDEDGMLRYVWDDEVGAHDIELAGDSGDAGLTQVWRSQWSPRGSACGKFWTGSLQTPSWINL